MSESGKARPSLVFHPNGHTGDFTSPQGLKGYFIFHPRSDSIVGAVITDDDKVGRVDRKDDDFYEFVIPGRPVFTLKAERTASGRIPLIAPISGPAEMCGPVGC